MATSGKWKYLIETEQTVGSKLWSSGETAEQLRQGKISKKNRYQLQVCVSAAKSNDCVDKD